MNGKPLHRMHTMDLSTSVALLFSRPHGTFDTPDLFIVFPSTDNTCDKAGNKIMEPYYCIHCIINPFSPSAADLPAAVKFVRFWNDVRQSKREIKHCMLDRDTCDIMTSVVELPDIEEGVTCVRKCSLQISVGGSNYDRIMDHLKFI